MNVKPGWGKTRSGRRGARQPALDAAAGRAQAVVPEPVQPRGSTRRAFSSPPHTRIVVLASSPTEYVFFCFPQEITPHNNKPKTTDNKPNASPSVLEHCSIAYQKEDSDNGTGFFFSFFLASLQEEEGETTNNSRSFLKHDKLHIFPVGRGKLRIRQDR